MTLPVPLDQLSAEDLSVLEPHLEPVRFRSGDCIFQMGSAADACFVLDQGEVRIEIAHEEIDSDTVLTFLGAGSFLGELGLLDRQPRSASAYAHSDVVARRITAKALDSLSRSHPSIALTVVSALGRDAAQKLRTTTGRLADVIADEKPDPEIDRMVAKAAAAQRAFEDWTDPQIDELLHDLASTVATHAERLAALTVKETRLGNVADKTFKNRFASLGIYRSLAGKPARGALTRDSERRVTELASPVGVIFAIIPMTNPVATAIFKSLISVKGRNALILSFPHQCLGIADAVGELIQRTLASHCAPADLVQWIRERPSRRKTTKFMKHPGISLILATGGAGMVKAAYSSGKPAIGVGPGNAPALICADADLESAAQQIVLSKSFDNGLICGAEHHLVVDARVRGAFVAALERHGAAVLSADEARRFTPHAFDAGRNALRSPLVGQDAQTIAEHTGIRRSYPIRLLVVDTDSPDAANPYAGEKLAPLVSMFTAVNEEVGLAICRTLLGNAGAGHTAIIHSRNRRLVERFGEVMPASRILVNSPGSHGCCGITTGLECSLTLGCGTFGGNSTTDNVSYRHLLNIKRIAHPLVTRQMEMETVGSGSATRSHQATEQHDIRFALTEGRVYRAAIGRP